MYSDFEKEVLEAEFREQDTPSLKRFYVGCSHSFDGWISAEDRAMRGMIARILLERGEWDRTTGKPKDIEKFI